MQPNLLCFGDNLNFLRNREILPEDSVDLIYLDPPFNSQESYNILFREAKGTPSEAQIQAFDDTWTWDEAAAQALHEIGRTAPVPVVETVNGIERILKHSPTFAYLVQMAVRLVEMHKILKSTGSLYLHCDPVAGHYLKIILDSIFGVKNFRREIVWRSGWVSGFKTRTLNWVRNHDLIFYYVKDYRLPFTFHKQYIPHPEGYERRGGEENPLGVPLEDVWTDIYSPWIMSFSKEKLGYKTQKPLQLLARIIISSSNPGDTILDPFCGCGTTVDAVETVNRAEPGQKRRRWIGIDITHLAINLIKFRLTRFTPPAHYQVIGEPADMASTRALAQENRYQFQYWALGQVGARPWGVTKKKGADTGIDGVRYFIDDSTQRLKSLLVQVKSGSVRADQIRDFRGVLEREKAEMGLFITLEEPTQPMRKEAASAGIYRSEMHHKDYPRLQILTVEELLKDSHRPNPACLKLPNISVNPTFDRAERFHRDVSKDQENLL
jgi:site-specific DNA-methyltransferase (adenine-specific)